MKVIVEVEAIRQPLTGIGRYALEIVKGLRRNDAITALRYFANDSWVDDPVRRLDARMSQPDPGGWLASLRGKAASNGLVQWGYRGVTAGVQRWRLGRVSDHVLFGPNYFLPAFGGVALATIHDLSIIRYPHFHPAARVAMAARLMPRTLDRASHLVTDSETVRTEVIDVYGWPESRVTAIPLGVDPAFRPISGDRVREALGAYELNPGGYCLCVSTIEPRKNLVRLMDAHAALPKELRRRYPLVLAGAHGWNNADIHDRIRSGSWSGNLRYLEYVPDPDLPALFGGAALFVLPSVYEGFGLPVLEAMACGVPVVASTCGALRELAEGVGVLVDAADTEGLTAALRSALEDDIWRQEARLKGLRRAGSYTWDKCVASTVELMTSLSA